MIEIQQRANDAGATRKFQDEEMVLASCLEVCFVNQTPGDQNKLIDRTRRTTPPNIPCWSGSSEIIEGKRAGCRERTDLHSDQALPSELL